MKKLLIICFILFLFCPFALSEEVEKEVFTSGDYEYILLDDGTAEITNYKYYYQYDNFNVVIPSTLDGHRVTAIGDYAFEKRDNLSSIVIPNDICIIGANLFLGNHYSLNIIVSPDHPTLEVLDGALLCKTDGRLVYYPDTLDKREYTIPEGVKKLERRHFMPVQVYPA